MLATVKSSELVPLLHHDQGMWHSQYGGVTQCYQELRQHLYFQSCSVATNDVSVSVCLVIDLACMPVILGMGAPTDLQEMSICTAYLGDHNSRGAERCCVGINYEIRFYKELV